MDILLIILAIVFAVCKDDKKKKKQKNNKRTKQPASADRKRTQQQKKQEQKKQKSAKEQFEEIARQRELKQRLEKKYRPPMQQKSMSDLAAADVQEDKAEKAKEKAKEKCQVSSKYTAPIAFAADDSEYMQKVYDLMVMGYSETLNFERDFLAEGMDMLNRIQVQ